MSDPSPTDTLELSGVVEPRGAAGLRWRMVLAITALVAVVLLATSAVLLVFSRDHLRDELERQARSYAALAVAPVCDAYTDYFESGFSKFRELIAGVTELNPSLEALAIFDTGGRLLFHSVELAQPTRLAPPEEIGVVETERFERALAGLELDAWSESDPFGRERYLVVAPYVEEWGRHRYSVAFFVSFDGLRAARRASAWQIAGLGVLGLALGVLCALVLSRWSLEPVEKLTRGARRLARGRLDEPIGLATGDEFQVLSETLDQMARRLAATIEDLEGSNRHLGRLNEELQQLDRLKSDLLANVSHELRTPLTAISGYVEAMDEGLLGELDDTQGEAVRVVRRNVRRLRGMIDQLLSYSRMEQSRAQVSLQPFVLEPVARGVVEALEAIHGDGLELRFSCPRDLPPVYGDPGPVAQVIENLLTNAIKFSPRGRPVELRVEATAKGAEVAVIDGGVGIPAALQDKIFERFYQVDASSRRKFGGMGLGLAIVREILASHHSEIHLESREGEGSTFRFTLPFAAPAGDAPASDGDRPRVALVDDDPGFVQGLSHHLADRGFRVDAAATAAQGRQLVERTHPDAVVLDRLLPDDDGFELLRHLAEDEATREIPVIVITVRHEKGLALRLGAAGYLTKPVAPERVERALLEVIDARRRRPRGAPAACQEGAVAVASGTVSTGAKGS